MSDFTNVGVEPESEGPTALSAEWGNAGLGKFSPSATPLIPPPAQAGLRYNSNVGINVFFTVSIDTVDLGSWSKCSGLGLALAYEQRQEEGMTFFEHHLPKHLTYTKITLERPLTKDCQAVISWLTAYHMLPIPTSAQITCIDQTGTPITSWEMTGVTPESWRGPNFDATAGTAAIATEQLSFFHQGFL